MMSRFASIPAMFTNALRRIAGFDVFICYPRLDALPYARALKKALEDDAKVFLDEVGLQIGDEFPSALRRHIRKSILPIVLVTEAALTSGWMAKEIEARIKRLPWRTRSVAPIFFPPQKPESLPGPLKALSAFNGLIEQAGANTSGQIAPDILKFLRARLKSLLWRRRIRRVSCAIVGLVLSYNAWLQVHPIHYYGDIPATVYGWQTVVVHPKQNAFAPLQVVSIITIHRGGSLVLMPDLQLNFAAKSGFVCEGELEARGTAGHKVRFEPAAGSGGWLGARFFGSGRGHFSQCEFVGTIGTGDTINNRIISVMQNEPGRLLDGNARGAPSAV